jgi:hypothetical protein
MTKASGTGRDCTLAAEVDPFLVMVVGGLVAFVVALVLIGCYHPRSGADVLDWRPTRSVETEVLLEFEDVDQMIEAANERRRRRGEREITEREVRERVAADLRASNARRESYLEDQDVAEMLAAKNARRRARGLPEITEDDYRAQIARELGWPAS